MKKKNILITCLREIRKCEPQSIQMAFFLGVLEALIPLISSLQSSLFVDGLERGVHTPLNRDLGENGVSLSGGELQRFCLARALIPGTRFLLCDEISAMLDLVTQAQIWNFLLEESEKRNLGLLIVSHNEALMERLCTRIVELPWKKVV